jgi:CelD/BcsL family acetyltransferase involved in cellulose biosynthesis
MHIKFVADDLDMPLSHEDWNELVTQNETDTLFQTYEWFTSWYKTFAENNGLCLLVIIDQNKPIGFAPLVTTNHENKYKTLQLAGYSNADYLDFVTPTQKGAAINLIFDYLVDKFNGWDRILLNNIPHNSSTISYVKNACNRLNLRYLQSNAINCPYLEIEGHHKEVAKLLNKYSNKRPLNYFRRQGELTYRVLNKDELEEHLPLFFSQHINRWANTPSPSLFNNPMNQLLYKNLAEQLINTDWLHFSVVELNGTPLSYHYGFDYNGKYYWYKPSFNIDYSSHSPGTLLIRYLIESALSRNRKEFDFTIGNESFKKRFANNSRQNINLHIFRRKKIYWFHNTLYHAAKMKRHIFNM